MMRRTTLIVTLAAGTLAAGFLAQAPAQTGTGLDSLPGYDRYEQATRRVATASRIGRLQQVHWREDGTALFFQRRGEHLRVDLETGEIEVIDEEQFEQADHDRDARPRVARGQQREREPSPCGRWIAVHNDWNVVIEPTNENDDDDNGLEPILVTTDGKRKHRFGKASWVYGEELRQNEAMWWSPDSRRLAYYEFDEREVPDYYLTGGNTALRTELLIEGYPKAGDPNPIAKLWIYDLDTGEYVQIDTHDAEDERYIYRVRFTPDGSELLFHRTNRHQNVLELVAACVETGSSRVILTEEQVTWQNNRPTFRLLDDGERFIWASERTDWQHYELWHIDGLRLATLTAGGHPVRSIEHVDEEREVLFYLAHSGPMPLNAHLHRVNFDGSDDRRLTEDGATHSVNISPDGRWFIEERETLTNAPVFTLRCAETGEKVVHLGTAGPVEPADANAELLIVAAADGKTTLYGTLHKPSDFDPEQTYPLLIDVYGGPIFQRVRNTWRPVDPFAEFGFIIARIDNRGTPHRGKAFEEATYLQLGVVDLDDQAAAVKQLLERPYIDAERVGIAGHSYGGYMAAIAMVRYPELFHVGVASAAVTDWRNYDTIYTERYMRTPQENPDGYDAGSAVKLAENLQGHLLILHGKLDDNVHPSNAWQLVQALQDAGKPFELMIYPERAHGLGRHARDMRWRFLHRHLIVGDENGGD